MARPPEVHALRTDDIPEAPGWLEKLVKPLTSHMTQVAQALTGQLTVKDNLAAKWVTVEVRGGAMPKPFAVGLGSRTAKAVMLAGASGGLEAPVGFTWTHSTVRQEDGRSVPAVALTRVTGVASGQAATLTFLIFPE